MSPKELFDIFNKTRDELVAAAGLPDDFAWYGFSDRRDDHWFINGSEVVWSEKELTKERVADLNYYSENIKGKPHRAGGLCFLHASICTGGEEVMVFDETKECKDPDVTGN